MSSTTTISNSIKRRRELIRRSLFLAGVSQAEIARRVGVTRGLVCHVIAGRRSHRAIEDELAAVCGMEPRELWED